MRPSPRTRLLAASVAMLATLSFAACGDDDDDDDAAGTASSEVDETTVDETTVDETTADATVDATVDETAPSSGGGEVGSQEDYVAAAKAEVDFEDEAIGDCFAEALVNDDIYAAIQEAGLSLEDFESDGPASLGIDDEAAGGIAAEMAACGELLPQILDDETEIACAEQSMSNDEFAEYIGFSLLGAEPSDEVQTAYEEIEACIDAAVTTTTG